MKLKCYTLLIVLVAICEALTAQPKLYVMDFTDAQTAYTLSTLRSITFTPGNMFVRKTTGVSDQYTVGTVRYLSFRDFTTDISPLVAAESGLTVFPNPVADRLLVSADCQTNEPMQVTICTMQGQVVYHQPMAASALQQGVSIDVQHYPAGVYLCRLVGIQTVSSAKFIKK